MDPRIEAINRRVANVRRIVCVASGKGGVGKSTVSTVSALLLSKAGYKVGLFDMDLYGPSVHTILGVKKLRMKEEKGVVPPKIDGIKMMSIVNYIGENPSLMRGVDISEAITELLAITQWGNLDFLIFDMPPGTGEEVLDVVKLTSGAEFLIVSTQSKVTLATVRRLMLALEDLKVPVLGVLENMMISKSKSVERLAEDFGMPFLGAIEFDRNLENSFGDAKKILKTSFARGLEKALGQIVKLE